MTRYTRLLLLSVFSLVLLIGCAQNPQVKAYQAGEVSKVTAETAYKAIYAAWKTGDVSSDVLAEANQAYESWRVAQADYVNSLRVAGTHGSIAQANLQEALLALLRIAATYNLL